MLTLLRNANLFNPVKQGQCDMLVGGGSILAIGERLDSLPRSLGAQELDLSGLRVIPGLVDPHVHVTGGGGESGPQSRVPPIGLGTLAESGITTCVGVLGTDGTTRSVQELLAKVLGLRNEGLSAYCYTGSYAVPPVTLTGSVRGDIAFVDPIIGVGEVAISDHRSSQPTFDELIRLAADCHVGGLLSGKAGVLHLHLGDGERGLTQVAEALGKVEVPARTYYPTHVNRRRQLFAQAMELAKKGCTCDVTAFPVDEDGLLAEDAIGVWLDEGLPAAKLTCSSDGYGCLPVFDNDGNMLHMDVGQPSAIISALRALLDRGRPLEEVLPIFTQSPADLLRLPKKGRLQVGNDADLVVLDPGGAPLHVMALGQWLVFDGAPKVAGTFEKGVLH